MDLEGDYKYENWIWDGFLSILLVWDWAYRYNRIFNFNSVKWICFSDIGETVKTYLFKMPITERDATCSKFLLLLFYWSNSIYVYLYNIVANNTANAYNNIMCVRAAMVAETGNIMTVIIKKYMSDVLHIMDIIMLDIAVPSHGTLIFFFFFFCYYCAFLQQCLKFLFIETHHRGWWHRSPVARMTKYITNAVSILSIVK